LLEQYSLILVRVRQDKTTTESLIKMACRSVDGQYFNQQRRYAVLCQPFSNCLDETTPNTKAVKRRKRMNIDEKYDTD